MIQKGIRVAMIIGALLVVGLITTLVIRECQSDQETQKPQTEIVVNK